MEMMAVEDDTTHARDLQEEEAWTLVMAMEGELKIMAFLMLLVGPRIADMEHIQQGPSLPR